MHGLLKVEVLEINSSGVLVKLLDNNQLGFIQRRELSWDRSLRSYIKYPLIGDQLDAILLPDTTLRRHLLNLSVRECSNPWLEAPKKYFINQIVKAEVVGVRDFGVFVQLEPGVEAIIWPRDIPMRKNEYPSHILSIGDRVQGVITKISYENRKIEINLIQRFFHSYKAIENSTTKNGLLDDLRLIDQEKDLHHDSSKKPLIDEQKSRWHSPQLPKLKSILVIDDEKSELVKICEHLKSMFKINVDCVETGNEGISLLKDNIYDLAIIDVRLSSEGGVEIAETLLNYKPDLEIIFMSFDPLAEKEIASIFGGKYHFALKDLEIITEIIDHLSCGYFEIQNIDEQTDKDKGRYVDHLGMNTYVSKPLSVYLSELLNQLRNETNVEQVIVVELDSLNRSVSILSSAPSIEEAIKNDMVDGLYYSPVREVIENEDSIYETDIKLERLGRLKNFFPLLEFHTYFGIPLIVPAMTTRYALFVFDEDRDFDKQILDQVRLAGRFIQMALEKSLLLSFMERYEKRYSLGLLLGSLVHEFRTKLDGLAGFSQSLQINLEKLNDSAESEHITQLSNSVVLAKHIDEVRRELIELVNAYTLLAKGEFEEVNVKTVIEKIKLLMTKRASEVGIQILIDIQPELPSAKGIFSRLEQIVSNLVLNAIQQIEKKNKFLAEFSAQNQTIPAIKKSGVIVIQAQYNRLNPSCPIQITVIDSGPGIHYRDQEKIFMLDISTREIGQGLGLFISRSLAESMGGRLQLVNSIINCGSVFMVELPKT